VSVGASNSAGTSTSAETTPDNEIVSPPPIPSIRVERTYDRDNPTQVRITCESAIAAGHVVHVKRATFGEALWHDAATFTASDSAPKPKNVPFDTVHVFQAFTENTADPDHHLRYSAPSPRVEVRETKVSLSGSVAGGGVYNGTPPPPPAPPKPTGTVSLGGASFTGPFDNLKPDLNSTNNSSNFTYEGSNSVPQPLTALKTTKIGQAADVLVNLDLDWDTWGFYTYWTAWSYHAQPVWKTLRRETSNFSTLETYDVTEAAVLPLGQLTSGGDGYDTRSYPAAVMLRVGTFKEIGFNTVPSSLEDYPPAKFDVSAETLMVDKPADFVTASPVTIHAAPASHDDKAVASVDGANIAELNVRSKVQRPVSAVLVEVRLIDKSGKPVMADGTPAVGVAPAPTALAANLTSIFKDQCNVVFPPGSITIYPEIFSHYIPNVDGAVIPVATYEIVLSDWYNDHRREFAPGTRVFFFVHSIYDPGGRTEGVTPGLGSPWAMIASDAPYMSRTVAHEFGHMNGLEHPWRDDAADTRIFEVPDAAWERLMGYDLPGQAAGLRLIDSEWKTLGN